MDYTKYLVTEAGNIHQQIQDIIKNGGKVRSAATGRMGNIISVSGNNVTIKTKSGKGVTSFLIGDKVKLIKNKSGEWVVTNI